MVGQQQAKPRRSSALSQTCAGNDCFSRLIDQCAPDAETEIRVRNILLFLLVHHTANAVDDYSEQTACIEMAKMSREPQIEGKISGKNDKIK